MPALTAVLALLAAIANGTSAIFDGAWNHDLLFQAGHLLAIVLGYIFCAAAVQVGDLHSDAYPALLLSPRGDGIVIYSVSEDMVDNGGRIDRESNPFEPGMDIGFRLWNPESRRQPPLPPIVEPEGEGR